MNLKILVIVHYVKFLLENDLNDHNTQSKDISFLEVYSWILTILRESNHELRREEYALRIALIDDLIIRPVGLLFSNYAPSSVISNSSISDSDVTSFDCHLRDSLNDGKQIIKVLRGDVLKQSKVREQEQIWSDEIMQGHFVG